MTHRKVNKVNSGNQLQVGEISFFLHPRKLKENVMFLIIWKVLLLFMISTNTKKYILSSKKIILKQSCPLDKFIFTPVDQKVKISLYLCFYLACIAPYS